MFRDSPTRNFWQGHPPGYRCGSPDCELDAERDDRLLRVRSNWLMLMSVCNWRCQGCRRRVLPRFLLRSTGFALPEARLILAATAPSEYHQGEKGRRAVREVLYFGEDRRTAEDYLEIVRVLCPECYNDPTVLRREVIRMGKKSGAGSGKGVPRGGSAAKKMTKHGKC